jgi:metal-responsive CopG/Arc/MetJ family transcriptional regulator
MTKKITITLEEELVEAVGDFAKRTGRKKTQIIREALKAYLPASKEKQEILWKNQNSDAIALFNERIKEEGVFNGSV